MKVNVQPLARVHAPPGAEARPPIVVIEPHIAASAGLAPKISEPATKAGIARIGLTFIVMD